MDSPHPFHRGSLSPLTPFPYHLVWTPRSVGTPVGNVPTSPSPDRRELPGEGRTPSLGVGLPDSVCRDKWQRGFSWRPPQPRRLPGEARTSSARTLPAAGTARAKEAEESHFQSRPRPRRGTGWEQGGGVSPQELVPILPAAFPLPQISPGRPGALQPGSGRRLGVPPTRIPLPGQGGRRSGPGTRVGPRRTHRGVHGGLRLARGTRLGALSAAESSCWRRSAPCRRGAASRGAGPGRVLREGRGRGRARGGACRRGGVCGRGDLAGREPGSWGSAAGRRLGTGSSHAGPGRGHAHSWAWSVTSQLAGRELKAHVRDAAFKNDLTISGGFPVRHPGTWSPPPLPFAPNPPPP